MLQKTRWAVIAVTLISLLTPVSADRISSLSKRLKHRDARVRAAAALRLGKTKSKRAINPCIGALGDKDYRVRAAAAAALGKLITPAIRGKTRRRADDALKKAMKDPSKTVQKQAKRALDLMNRKVFPTGGIYVHVDDMGVKSDNAKPFAGAMRMTTKKTVERVGKNMYTSFPGTRAPKKSQLRQKRAKAYFVGGTITSLNFDDDGVLATVSCKVSMYIASYPEKSMFGFASAGGSIQAGASDAAQKEAATDCVTAVVENLVRKKIVPGIGAMD